MLHTTTKIPDAVPVYCLEYAFQVLCSNWIIPYTAFDAMNHASRTRGIAGAGCPDAGPLLVSFPVLTRLDDEPLEPLDMRLFLAPLLDVRLPDGD